MTAPEPDEQTAAEQRRRARERMTMDDPVTFEVFPDAAADEESSGQDSNPDRTG